MEEETKWNDTCDRFVAFLDIMGFKDRVFREEHEDVKKMLLSLRKPISTIEENVKNPLIQQVLKSQDKDDVITHPSIVYPVTFSDSIILISDDASDISAMFLFSYVSWILQVAFEKRIPMKGAIAYGEMTSDQGNSLYFGEPLIDAFELQKELKLYGVILHHTCQQRINKICSFDSKGVYKYLVPMKSGKITHYLVDWTPNFKDKNEPLNLVNDLYCIVSGKPRKYVDNTIEFLEWLEKEKNKPKEEKKP